MKNKKSKKTKPYVDPDEKFNFIMGLIVIGVSLLFPPLFVGMIFFAILGPGVSRLGYWSAVDDMGTRGANYDNPTNRSDR
tara:strand:+ start:384 stop:623 length:240 start_codon:yes stop_codon:yes gene_type:complete